MTEQSTPKKEQNGVSPETDASSTNSRRSFLTKAVIAAPLLTTIASRPAWGTGTCTVSGNLSNNTSNHDHNTHCEVHGYSGGAWCEGHADNNDFWALIGLTKDSLLVTLIPSYYDSDTSTEATIGDALDCTGYKYSNLNEKKKKKGKWKQRTAAALNLKLWEVMTADYQTNNCLPIEYEYVHEDFYFPTTLDVIMAANTSTLDNANRDGFTGSVPRTTC